MSQPAELGEDFYLVRQIVDKKIQSKTFYKVLWLNYPDEDFTWEPIQNLNMVLDLVESLESKLASESPTKRKSLRHRKLNVEQNIERTRDAYRCGSAENEVSAVIACKRVEDSFHYLCEFKNGLRPTYLSSELLREKFPAKLLSFLEERVPWRLVEGQ